MAVKKNSKIDLYKFVAVPKPSAKGKTREGKRQNELVTSFATFTTGFNNLGKTLNSVSRSMVEMRDTQFAIYKAVSSQAKSGFVAKYNLPTAPKPQQGPAPKEKEEKESPSWLESLFNLLVTGLLGGLAVGAFKWLSNEENRKKTKETLEKLFDILGVITNFFGTVAYHAIDGLWQLLCNEDASWLDKFGGFIKGFTALGLGILGIRWLKNPLKILKDFKGAFKFFGKALRKTASKAVTSLKRAGVVALVAGAAYGTYQIFKGENEQEAARGGKLKKFARGGGFINGPMSGYPVSLDGGKSTAFIGHGLEYVAQKSSGGFVVPINTPATKNNPGLMGQRMTEASRMGYNLGGMMKGFDGGGEYRDGEARGVAKQRANKEEKRFAKMMRSAGGLLQGFARGGELAKLGDGTKLVNAPAGYCTTGVLNTAQANNAKIGAPHVATGRDRNNPRGLMAQAVKNFGYAALNIGQSKKITSPYGNVNVKEMNFGQWKKAVKGNKVPSGSLVFSTRHSDWNNSASSSGNDSAIAKNGGRKLWSGHWQAVVDGVGAVYGAGTKKVVALVHPKNHRGGYDGSGGSNDDSGGGGEMALSGIAKQRVGNDTAFLKEVKRVARKVGVHPSDLLGLMASESGLNPQAQNKSGATGLIQFMPDTARGLGTSTGALMGMTRVEQMKYVEKFLTRTLAGVSNPTPGHLYTSVYLPAFAKKPASYVLAKRGGFTDSWGHHPAAWYTHNAGLDMDKDGSITIGELSERIAKKKREFGISGGGGSYSGGGGGDDDSGDTGSLVDGVAAAASYANPMEAFEAMAGKIFGEGWDSSGAEASGSPNASPGVSAGASGTDASKKGTPVQENTPATSTGHFSKSGGANAGGPKGGPGDKPTPATASPSISAPSGGSASAALTPATTAGAKSVSASSTPSSSATLTSQTNTNVKQKGERQQQARQAIASVAQLTEIQNAETRRVAAAAAQGNVAAAASSKKQKPVVVPTGGSSKPSLISQLNSRNNILRTDF